MSFEAMVYQVMIASPSDVPEERQIATEEVNDWNALNSKRRGIVLLPVKWETHTTPQFGEHPQAVITRQILEDADILIGIFGLRLGTPTPTHESGTVEEIAVHSTSGRTVKLYFSEAPLPRDYDRPQYDALQRFAERCRDKGLHWGYKNASDFRNLLRRHLQLELQDERYVSPALVTTGHLDSSLSSGTTLYTGKMGPTFGIPLLEVGLRMTGTPDAQVLLFTATRSVSLLRIDFLTSSGIAMGGFDYKEDGARFSILIPHSELVKVFNTPRIDRMPYDHSGPARLRVRFVEARKPFQVELNVLMEPRIVNNTQWIALTGAETYQLQ